MALIKCEKCGGQVSDSALKCPHCGFDFSEKKAKEEVSKEYTRLTEQERQSLRKEYDAGYSGYAQAEKKEKRRRRLQLAFICVAFLALGVAYLFEQLYESDKYGLFVLFVILSILVVVAGIIGASVEMSLQKRRKRELIRELKKFQAWLKDEKQLTYHIVLTQKERIIFEEINIKNQGE